jgi:hypothetical protein
LASVWKIIEPASVEEFCDPVLPLVCSAERSWLSAWPEDVEVEAEAEVELALAPEAW